MWSGGAAPGSAHITEKGSVRIEIRCHVGPKAVSKQQEILVFLSEMSKGSVILFFSCCWGLPAPGEFLQTDRDKEREMPHRREASTIATGVGLESRSHITMQAHAQVSYFSGLQCHCEVLAPVLQNDTLLTNRYFF